MGDPGCFSYDQGCFREIQLFSMGLKRLKRCFMWFKGCSRGYWKVSGFLRKFQGRSKKKFQGIGVSGKDWRLTCGKVTA